MELIYSHEKMLSVIRLAAGVTNSEDIAKRISDSLSEINNLKDDLKNHPETKSLYEEIFSLIDYTEESNIYHKNVVRMSPSVRIYLLKLIFKLYFAVDSIYFASTGISRESNPEVDEWRSEINRKNK